MARRGQDRPAAASDDAPPGLVELLRALGQSGRSLEGLTLAEAEAKLAETVEAARKELAWNARGIDRAPAPPHDSGDPLLLDLGPPAPQPSAAMTVSFSKGWERQSSEWKHEGPWGDSLAWLGEQNRPEASDRCERCNWHGRYRELRGVDDGTNPEKFLRHRNPNSVGARKPFLERYVEANEPIDNLHGLGDGRCVECGGTGYVDQEIRNAGPQLRPRPSWGVEDERDDYDLRDEAAVFDVFGRLCPRRPSTDHGYAVQAEASAREGIAGLFSESKQWPSVGILADEQKLALSVLASARRFLETGWLGGEAEQSRASREALKRAFRMGSVVDEIDYLRSMIPSGGGRQRAYRKDAFAERDALLLEYVLLDTPVELLTRVFSLSEQQIKAIPLVKGARRLSRRLRDLMIHRWHGDGHANTTIAEVCGISARTVQRVLARPPDKEPDEEEFMFLSIVLEWPDPPPGWQEWIFLAIFNQAAPGGDLNNNCVRRFVGFLLFGQPPYLGLGGAPGDPYHTWVPSPEDRDDETATAGEELDPAETLGESIIALSRMDPDAAKRALLERRRLSA